MTETTRCDSCGNETASEELEAVLSYVCRECAGHHALDVTLGKAAVESLIAELLTRGSYFVLQSAAAFAVLEAARDFKCKKIGTMVMDHGWVYQRTALNRLCLAIEAWRLELGTQDTEKGIEP